MTQGRALFPVALLDIAINGFSQQSQEYTFQSSVQLVSAEVTVLSKRTGAPIDGLMRDDFHVLDEGREQLITHFGRFVPTNCLWPWC